MGIKNLVTRAAGKVADKVSKLSSLSPEQLQNIQEQRDDYLSQMPDLTDTTAEELTKRLLAASSVEIYNAYLAQLKDLYVPVERDVEYGKSFDIARNVRFINITKWVVDKRENSLEKLINVYAVLSNEECNISLIFHRTKEAVNVYLAITNTQNADNNVDIENYKTRLCDALKGNFPGSEWSKENGIGALPCLENDYAYSVAIASNLPTEKSEKFISQTIEKLLDGIIPEQNNKEYIVILLATPVRDAEYRKLSLAEVYSSLAPFASWSTNFTYTELGSTGSSATVGVNVGASAGIQNGQNQSITNTDGITDSTSDTITDSTSDAITSSSGTTMTDSTGQTVTDSTGSSVANTTGFAENISTTQSEGTSVTDTNTTGRNQGGSIGIPFIGYNRGVNTTDAESFSSNLSEAVTEGVTTSTAESIATSTGRAIAETTGKAIAETAGQALTSTVGRAVSNTLGRAVSSSVSKTAGIFKSTSFGANFGASFARSSNITATIGKNEGINQTFTNYNIKHALELLETQMKRLELSTALGMWDFAAYVLSEDQNVANNVAHTYVALTQGEESNMSNTAINLWRGDMGASSDDAKEICSYLRELRHPIFGLNPNVINESPDFNVYPPIVTATTNLSGKELAYSLNFPQKSVSGLPVIECVDFGRNVVTYDSTYEKGSLIEVGKIFHMNQEENTSVNLSIESLASHTFITGSTGSGKSNTVYWLLNQLQKQDITFMVIEPAKGEYKRIFGGNANVSVYGTNHSLTQLLRIDPFSFPDGIHVLEHLDRLIEIFNVCWPMYAAMPAVLKSAVEKSYIDCGWDLLHSTNKYGENLYPSFGDVARNIKDIIDNSEYDTENKGAYKGSLLTRLESLTNGINGIIFNNDAIPNTDLFDKNVIIDLSRVGSSETKSMIMGMLVLKLQEHRMANATGINESLKHITVIEEAHNLLKRTSTEYSSESSNLRGKSVEMLSNAIAEMRTYGEGFIIADQAPGLLDLSVIRNTNTKILMRLPDRSDRELVGRAANLNDDQIAEISRFPLGVAAIYQNEWIQPVLAKVHKNPEPQNAFSHIPDENTEYMDLESTNISKSLLDCIMNKELFRRGNRTDISNLKSMVLKSKLDLSIKQDFLEYLSSDNQNTIEALRSLIYSFLAAEEAIKASRHHNDIDAWVRSVVGRLEPSILDYSKKQIDLALALIILEQSVRDSSYNDILCSFTEKYKAGGGVY